MRLGLAGGGSDVSPYSDIYGGLVLNATINLFAYCIIEERGDDIITVNSVDTDFKCSYPLSDHLDIDGHAILIKGVYNRVVRQFDVHPSGFRITTYNDAPIGSGLGTSSSMVVCILKAFVEWQSLPLGDYEISQLAYEIERKELMLSGGKQDQYSAAFGGFNFMEFHKNDLVLINPLKIKRWIIDELESSLILFYSGKSRSSAVIIDEQKKNTSSGNIQAIEAMHKIKQSAIEMKTALLKGDIHSFAKIMGEGWESKKQMAKEITNPKIQLIMETAMNAGAISGKVSGAGGGGFVMIAVDPVNRKNVEKALSTLDGHVMPFQFTEGGAHGWKIYD